MEYLETDNFKFSQNTKCEYFPCHKVKEESTFNCLFCFCPLYMLKDKCGGNFVYTKNVKDCSNCTKTHAKNAYEFVMSKMDIVVSKASEKE